MFNALPDGLLAYIFEFLRTDEVLRLSPVCKDFYRVQQTLAEFSVDFSTLRSELLITPRKLQDELKWLQPALGAKRFQDIHRLQVSNFGAILRDEHVQPILSRHAATLRSCSFSGTGISAPVIKCPLLQVLDLSYCPDLLQVSAIPIVCPLLRELDLSRTAVTDSDLQRYLPPLHNLLILRLSRCKNIRLFSLTAPKLEQLDLSFTAISDLGIQNITALKNSLKLLLLSGCEQLLNPQIKSLSLTSLALDKCSRLQNLPLVCPKLTDLNLSETPLRDVSLSNALANLPSLRSLKIREALEIQQPEFLYHFPNLTSLDLSQSGISDIGVTHFLYASPNLQYLYLQQCYRIRDRVRLPPSLSLQHLNCGATMLSEQGLKAVLGRCQSLRELSLRSCPNISGESISRLDSLQLLDLSASNITDATIARISASCKQLRELVVEHCHRLEKVDIRSESLQELSLVASRNVSAISLQCPRLRKVDLRSMMCLIAVEAKSCRSIMEVHLEDTPAMRFLARRLMSAHKHLLVEGSMLKMSEKPAPSFSAQGEKKMYSNLQPAVKTVGSAGSSVIQPQLECKRFQDLKLDKKLLISRTTSNESLSEVVEGDSPQFEFFTTTITKADFKSPTPAHWRISSPLDDYDSDESGWSSSENSVHEKVGDIHFPLPERNVTRLHIIKQLFFPDKKKSSRRARPVDLSNSELSAEDFETNAKPKHKRPKPIIVRPGYFEVEYGGWTFEMHDTRQRIASLEARLKQRTISRTARYGFKRQVAVLKAQLQREISKIQRSKLKG